MARIWLVASAGRVLIATATVLWCVTMLVHAFFADFVIDLLILRSDQLVFLDRWRVVLAEVWNLTSCSVCVSYAVVRCVPHAGTKCHLSSLLLRLAGPS